MRRFHMSVTVAVTVALVAGVASDPAGAAPPNPVAPSPKATARTALAAGHHPSGQHLSVLPPLRARSAPAPRDAVLIAHLDRGATLTRVASSVRGAHLAVRHESAALRAVTVRVPSADEGRTRALLQAIPGVHNVEIAVVRHLQGVPNDTDYAHDQSSYLDAVNAPAAWSIQHGSAAVKIAVVDSGVDVNHEDLTGKVVGTYNAVDGTSDVTDTLGHGTFVAGVAAAHTNNALGVAGAGFDTSILAVKVADSSGNISVADEAAGITWAADNGADIINLSLGSATASQTEQDAITYAQGKGVLVVAAAGNENKNTPDYPAGYSDVVAVAATTGSTRASFSNFGSWVTLAAPGVGIFSTTPPAGSQFFPAAAYGSGDGTSFSTPLVAGAAALVKAQYPTDTAAAIRAALVASARPLAGQDVGAGLIDFGAALAPTSTPSVTAPAPGDTVSGVVTFSASSSAAAVEFAIDGGPYSAPTSVSGATATLVKPLWGYANGAHTVTARDCTPYGACSATPSAPVGFTLADAVPTVTAPAAGALVSGGFTITASAPGGGLRFLIDGARVGFDSTAPYSLVYSGSSLTEGRHVVSVVECSTTEDTCNGPASAGVQFDSRSLHPAITSALPSPFSPNGDGRNETTKIVISVPDTEHAALRVVNSAGTVVLGPVALGTYARGSHAWVWNGRTATGRAPDGTYTMLVTTSSVVSGVTLLGRVSRDVRVDTQAPALSAVTGGSTTFYPYPDHYRDTVTTAATVGEAGYFRLYVVNSAGTTVQLVPRTVHAGRNSLVWNGYLSSGRIAPTGYYRFYLWIMDVAGNVRHTGYYTLFVSDKRLVPHTATLAQHGSSRTSVYGDTNCMLASTADSDFSPYGEWLDNECDPTYVGFEFIIAYYRFTVPSATRYGTLRASAYGNSLSRPTEMFAQYCAIGAATCGVGRDDVVSAPGNAWQDLGSVSGDGRVDGSHRIDIGIAVDNNLNISNGAGASDFDIDTVRLALTYYVLT